MSELAAPFPYPGGKKGIVELVWQGLGPDAASYLEPFAGSAAMLFGQPSPGKYELINDTSGLVANVLRSIKLKPAETAAHCDDPPCELDLKARAKLLREWGPQLSKTLGDDADFCDPKAAGWWIWCQSVGLGPDWLDQASPSMLKPYRRGILALESPPPLERLTLVSERLRRVSIACGGWERLVTPSALGFNTTGTTPTAIFGDPPYPDEELDYGSEPGVAQRFAAWCLLHGEDPRLRICITGHVGDYDLPGWRAINWGGSRGWGRGRRGANECAWFSPHCFQLKQVGLFEVRA